MKLGIAITALLLACDEKPVPSGRDSSKISADPPAADSVISVTGPTLMAFYPNPSQSPGDSSEDVTTALDDFSFHLSTASDSLRRLGFVILQQVRGPFHLKEGSVVREFIPAPDSPAVGYVFIVPGHQDRVRYGVMTNAELIDVGRSMLGPSPPPPGRQP